MSSSNSIGWTTWVSWTGIPRHSRRLLGTAKRDSFSTAHILCVLDNISHEACHSSVAHAHHSDLISYTPGRHPAFSVSSANSSSSGSDRHPPRLERRPLSRRRRRRLPRYSFGRCRATDAGTGADDPGTATLCTRAQQHYWGTSGIRIATAAVNIAISTTL
jgi:hypothetical protein